MGENNAKTQADVKTCYVKIRASMTWWERFERWMALHGYQSNPEGFRAAANDSMSRTDVSQV